MANCSCNGEPLVAAIDQRFESEADGSPVIHWLDASTWSRFGGKLGLLQYFTLLGVEGTSTSVTIVARGGSDGKSWQFIDGLQEGPYNSGVISTTPMRIRSVPSNDARLPPLVQLGLKVDGSTELGAVRVTWLIEAISGTGVPIVVQGNGTMGTVTAGQVLTDGTLDLLGEADVIFGAVVPSTTDIELYTSGDGSTWYLADAISFGGAGSGARKATNVLRYVELRNKTEVTTGTINWSLSAVARG
ncbi:MAG: hypothetical protein H6747_13615 [Deltaproteobacteria bacterium]|nr:hypothetical protein [Deltaproteobacteria bacterium]